jgi:chromosome segregation and condensation protein ScpB
MTNPKRGEVELQFGDKKYQGKINLDTIMRIETMLGCSIFKLTQQLSEGLLSTTEIIAIIQPVLRSSSEKLEEKQVKELVWSYGIANAMRECGKVLTLGLSSGDEGKEELEEQTT